MSKTKIALIITGVVVLLMCCGMTACTYNAFSGNGGRSRVVCVNHQLSDKRKPIPNKHKKKRSLFSRNRTSSSSC